MNSSSFVSLFLTLLCGFLFGLALEKGRVFEPDLIRAQMHLQKFLMLKMFLAAVITSFLSFIIISIVKPSTLKDIRSTPPTSSGRVLIGSSLLGIGMTLSGACPGTVFAQLGAGVGSAFITFLGAILGAIVWTRINEGQKKQLNQFQIPGVRSVFLDQQLNVTYFLISFSLIGVFLVVLFLIENSFPWYREYMVDQNDVFPMIQATAWPPYMSGMLIGFIQLLALLFFGKTIGASSAFESLAYLIQSKIPKLQSEQIQSNAQLSFQTMWQLIYVVGAILGAFFSAICSNTFAQTNSLPLIPSFLGGFFIVLGARLAGGCTSGHGISGVGKLAVPSFLAVIMMFSAAMLTGIFV